MATKITLQVEGKDAAKTAMDQVATAAEKAQQKAADAADKAAAKAEAAKAREERAAAKAAAKAEAERAREERAAQRAAQREADAKERAAAKETAAAEKAAAQAEAARQKEAAAAEQSAARQAAAVEKAGHKEAAAAMGRTQNATRNLTFAVQDLLAGGAMGGLKGALLGASNNLAVVAMQFGGLAGIVTSIAVSALPLFISQTKKAADETDYLADSLKRLTDAEDRRRSIGGMSSQEAEDEITVLQKRAELLQEAQFQEEKRILFEKVKASEGKISFEDAKKDLEVQKEIRKVTGVMSESAQKLRDIRAEILVLEQQRETAANREASDKDEAAKAEEARAAAVKQNQANAAEAAKLAQDQAAEEERMAQAKIDAAKVSEDPREVAAAQADVNRELHSSVNELQRLNKELEKADDRRSPRPSQIE